MKYDKHKLTSQGVDDNAIDYDNVYIAIANELAEKNRLKRIELKIKANELQLDLQEEKRMLGTEILKEWGLEDQA